VECIDAFHLPFRKSRAPFDIIVLHHTYTKERGEGKGMVTAVKRRRRNTYEKVLMA
jgi:hypothetical protein